MLEFPIKESCKDLFGLPVGAIIHIELPSALPEAKNRIAPGGYFNSLNRINQVKRFRDEILYFFFRHSCSHAPPIIRERRCLQSHSNNKYHKEDEYDYSNRNHGFFFPRHAVQHLDSIHAILLNQGFDLRDRFV